MPWTIESALNDDLAHDQRRLVGEYQFRVGDLETRIHVRLLEDVRGNGVHFEQSHFIHTPTQGGPYATSRPWGDDEGYALHQAVTSITLYYRQAVDAGHKPQESWLVPNRSFGHRPDQEGA
jgi:hypothetical protein